MVLGCAWMPGAACSGGSLPANASSDANGVGSGPDPSSLAPPPGTVQAISMANRNACLRPATGAGAVAQDRVGVGPCSGNGNDQWRLNADGTLGFGPSLCLGPAQGQIEAGAAVAVVPCEAGAGQVLTLSGGRLLLGTEGMSPLAVTVGDGSADASGFVAATLAQLDGGADNSAQKWQVGLAQTGPSGDANVIILGFPIALASAPGFCMTGRNTTVGVVACNGSASQTWIVNEAGGLQLGAYCLSATTPGTISQGTPALFALCRAEDPGQAWQVQGGLISLDDWHLSPTTMPPPQAGYTPTALVTSQVGWLLGG
jgi:hypothetical protein